MPEPIFPPDAGGHLAAFAFDVLFRIAEAHPGQAAFSRAAHAEIALIERCLHRPSFVDIPDPLERTLLHLRNSVLRAALAEIERAHPDEGLQALLSRTVEAIRTQTSGLVLDHDGRVVRPDP